MSNLDTAIESAKRITDGINNFVNKMTEFDQELKSAQEAKGVKQGLAMSKACKKLEGDINGLANIIANETPVTVQSVENFVNEMASALVMVRLLDNKTDESNQGLQVIQDLAKSMITASQTVDEMGDKIAKLPPQIKTDRALEKICNFVSEIEKLAVFVDETVTEIRQINDAALESDLVA